MSINTLASQHKTVRAIIMTMTNGHLKDFLNKNIYLGRNKETLSPSNGRSFRHDIANWELAAKHKISK
jgi:hypothetical protein